MCCCWGFWCLLTLFSLVPHRKQSTARRLKLRRPAAPRCTLQRSHTSQGHGGSHRRHLRLQLPTNRMRANIMCKAKKAEHSSELSEFLDLPVFGAPFPPLICSWLAFCIGWDMLHPVTGRCSHMISRKVCKSSLQAFICSMDLATCLW